jgi:hypothetical protein
VSCHCLFLLLFFFLFLFFFFLSFLHIIFPLLFLFSTNTFSSYFLLNITPCNKIFLSRFPLKTTLLTLSLYFFFLLRFFYSPPLFPFDFFIPPLFSIIHISLLKYF